MKREETKLGDYKAKRRGLRIELRYTKIMRDHDTSKILAYIFTVRSPCNRQTIVGIESVHNLPYQSMQLL